MPAQPASKQSRASARARPRICLAASGGGHLQQILDIAEAWTPFDHFFVTEDTALGRSLAGRAHFVPHFGLGQWSLGHPFRLAAAAFINFVNSARIVLRERPDLVITTGAGATFFCVLFARAAGARVILIESFARVKTLSVFGRYAGWLAHHKVVQSRALTALWPDAALFDPLRILDEPPPRKSALLFATVGATLPFDRLTDAVARLKRDGHIAEEVIIQRGKAGVAPEGVTSIESLPLNEILRTTRRARIVVCHGGTGSLVTSLREGCHVIVMTRRFELGEHYDNHQSEIADAFRDRGLVQVARTRDELLAALGHLAARTPVVATSDYSDLVAHVKTLISAHSRPAATAGSGEGAIGRPP